MSRGKAKRVVLAVLLVALKAVWVSAMVIIPLLGMWLSSSLAAYRNSSLWVSLAVGLVLFPVVPLAWDAIYLWRRRRSGTDRPHILTRLDRLVLRTLCVNALFFAVTLWSSPATAFRALATRGDWMLEGRDGAVAETMRSGLFALADALEGLYGRAGSNHFGTSDTEPPPPPPPPPPDEGEPELEPDKPPPPPPDSGDEVPRLTVGETTYPHPAEPHPLAATLANAATYAEAARAIGAQVSDPLERVKALHDVVVARLTYDDETFEAYEAGRFGDARSQKAPDVWAARTGVCEGYARLLSAMGAEIDIEIAYVVGRGGRDGFEVDGVDHAWSAAKIGERWYLIDATWDDGEDQYDTAYLFTPPALFRLDHLPEDDRWQLHHEVLSVSDFMRQPMISPQFVLFGLTMERPDRAQVTVADKVDLRLGNPRRTNIIAKLKEKSGAEHDCSVKRLGAETQITCEMPGEGRYTVDIYGKAGRRAGTYPHIAKLFVNSK